MKKIPLGGHRSTSTVRGYAIIDNEDYEVVKKYNWHLVVSATGRKHAGTNVINEGGAKRILTMHRLILNAPKKVDVDHINHDALDNRKKNLRICSRAENNRNRKLSSYNTSGYKGVARQTNPTKDKKWRAYISVTKDNVKKYVHLGVYRTKKEAHAAYCVAAKHFQKDFACFG